MIIKHMNYQIKHYFDTILLARIHVHKSVFLSLIFMFFLSYQFIVKTTISIPLFSYWVL